MFKNSLLQDDVKGFAVIDLETTGRSAKDKIIEVGVVLTDLKGNITGVYHSLVRPALHIPSESTAIHGIDDNMVKHAPTMDMLASQLLKTLDSRLLVAHNANFEARFLHAELNSFNVEITVGNFVDTLRLSRKYLSLPNNKLVTVSKFYDAQVENPHMAVSDAYSTAKVLAGMIEHNHVPLGDLKATPFYANDYEDVVLQTDFWLPRVAPVFTV